MPLIELSNSQVVASIISALLAVLLATSARRFEARNRRADEKARAYESAYRYLERQSRADSASVASVELAKELVGDLSRRFDSGRVPEDSEPEAQVLLKAYDEMQHASEGLAELYRVTRFSLSLYGAPNVVQAFNQLEKVMLSVSLHPATSASDFDWDAYHRLDRAFLKAATLDVAVTRAPLLAKFGVRIWGVRRLEGSVGGEAPR